MTKAEVITTKGPMADMAVLNDRPQLLCLYFQIQFTVTFWQ